MSEKRDIKQEIEYGVSMLYFSAPWCGPCKMMSPIVSEIITDNIEQKVMKLDVEEYQELGSELGVRSIPTFIIFKDGIETDRWSGVKDKSTIIELLKNT